MNGKHYTRVLDFDLSRNTLTCQGPVKASSESLTHAALYETCVEAQAIIHVHHKKLWKTLKHQVPTSDAKVPYGTPEMATEIRRLIETTDLPKKKILVMAGHEEGVVTFGKDCEEAGKILFRHLKRP